MTQLVKFFPTTKEAQDIVLWVDDIEASVQELGINEAIGQIMDRVIFGDLKCSGYVHVIDDNKELAKNMAMLLDANYTKEMELMKTIKPAATTEETVLTTATAEEKKAAKIAKSEAAKKLLSKHIKEEDKKEEKEMSAKEEKKESKGNRRRLNTGAAKQEETVTENNNNEKVEKDMKKPSRKSTGRVLKPEATSKKPADVTNRKKLGTSASIKSEFVKFDGPWYLNSSLYSVIGRFGQIMENLMNGEYADVELGIETIVLVDPEEISRYRNRTDILIVVQVKANGNILEFPIKEASANSSSDLSSTSIGWVELKNGGMRPAFGHHKMNSQVIEAKCTCGHEFKAHPENVYCEKCDSLYDVIDMDNHKQFTYSFSSKSDALQVKKVFEFITAPNLVVPRETLALVMAIAQNELDLDMHGVGEEA